MPAIMAMVRIDGRVLIKKGELSAGQAGWTQIRRWIEMNPQKTDALWRKILDIFSFVKFWAMVRSARRVSR